MPSSAADISKRIRALADPVRAEGEARYFKTGPGQTGEGQKFLGLKTDDLRAIVRECWRETPNDEILQLLASEFHEERAAALLIWVEKFKRCGETERGEICTLYLANTTHIDNWALVDCSAEYIVGPWLEDKPRDILYSLARSPSLWERRIAIISTLHFIRRKDFADTLSLAKILLTDREDLIHKATGWMLREVGKRDEAVLCGFLDEHAGVMPRTALRYAIERMEESERQRYLTMGKRRTTA
ncbi:MAG TPA: DNA alkylation repair protein [Opitutales bacterium]|nr:DNA alkylation repair protein [Opitutales bacterium]